jgi:hypothetical protein
MICILPVLFLRAKKLIEEKKREKAEKEKEVGKMSIL